MKTCSTCGLKHRHDECPRCHPQVQQAVVSVADDTLDSMVQAASTPSLATLFRRAKDQGVISGVTVYGEGDQHNAANQPSF